MAIATSRPLRGRTSVAIFAVVILASALLLALNGLASRSYQIQLQIAGTHALAHELSALEWRMIAEGTVDAETERSMIELSDALSESLDQAIALDSRNAQLRSAQGDLDEYIAAMKEETQLLKSGDAVAAKRADEERVDPAFEKLANSLNAANTVFAARVSAIRPAIYIVSILLLVGSGALIAYLFARNQQARLEVFQASADKEILVQAAKHHEELTLQSEALKRRNVHLLTASRVAREAAAIKEPVELVNDAVRLISDQFGYYHAGIFLLDESGENAILLAASSEGGQRMLARGHRLKVGEQGVVGFAAAQKRPHIALDIGADAAYFDNPELSSTRSEAALPLIAHDKVIGVLDIQSDKPQAFTQEDMDIFQTLADQLALAIENTQLLSGMEALLQQMQQAAGEQSQRSWASQVSHHAPAYQYTPLGIQQVGTLPASQEEDGSFKVPIILRGRSIGNILLKRRGVGTGWLEQEQTMVKEVAAQVALALENARLLEDAQQRATHERSLIEISTRIGSAFDVDAILRTTAQEIGKILGDSEVTVQVRPESMDA